MKLLKGEHISLRAVEPADLELLLQWENDPENWTISNTHVPFSRDVMIRYIQNAHQDIYQTGQWRFMIESNSSNQTIGTADIFDFDPHNKRAGLGILIGDKQERMNGHATESLQLLIKYCMDFLDLKQVHCGILEDNEASLKLFAKLGFEVSGRKGAWVREGDTFKDELFLQLIKN